MRPSTLIPFMLLSIAIPLFGHGMNWSKVYIERNGERLSVELRVNDLNIALLPELQTTRQPVEDLLRDDLNHVNSVIWNGITVTVDGTVPGTPVDNGYNIADERSDPQSQEGFHSHGRTVTFRKTWVIPAASAKATIIFHLFSGRDIPMKWLVLAGERPKWSTSINHPGDTVVWDFNRREFLTPNAPSRFRPLWIAISISSVLIAASVLLYLLLAKRSTSPAAVKRS